MTELSQISHQLKRDDLSEAETAWQQVAGLEEGAFSGSEVHYCMLKTTQTSNQLLAATLNGIRQSLTTLGPFRLPKLALSPCWLPFLSEFPAPAELRFKIRLPAFY